MVVLQQAMLFFSTIILLMCVMVVLQQSMLFFSTIILLMCVMVVLQQAMLFFSTIMLLSGIVCSFMPVFSAFLAIWIGRLHHQTYN
jgi:membrane-associated HD superfamily phosphohydrolase